MNEEQKQKYLEYYKKAKAKGIKFFPDVIYKDMLVSFAIFLLLVGLATFVGVANEPKVDPSDSTYVPRPEWYFLFLFEMLKYFPGALEWVGTVVIPGLAVGALFLLPFFDRNPYRHFSRRKFALGFMSVVVIAIVALTIMGAASTPPAEEVDIAGSLSEQITLGTDLYSIHCVECHGTDGEGGEVVGVEGMEGVIIKPINSQDEMYTRTDDTFFEIINYGQPDLGMTPFGKGYGGELGPGDIENIVAFMRYTWDDRAEMPQDAAQAGSIPVLAEGEVPSYEVHIAPLVKRYCISCHRPGKTNNNYHMGSYDEILQTGDNTPNLIAGDLNSNLIRMIHYEEIEEVGGVMPPKKQLPPEYIDMFDRWVLAGMPNTAQDAAAVTPANVEPAIETPAVITSTVEAPAATTGVTPTP